MNMILLHNRKCIAVYVISIVILIFNSSSSDASANTRQSKQWLNSTPEAQGMHSQMLADMMGHIEKNRLNIDSIIIVRNGHMVFDAAPHFVAVLDRFAGSAPGGPCAVQQTPFVALGEHALRVRVAAEILAPVVSVEGVQGLIDVIGGQQMA